MKITCSSCGAQIDPNLPKCPYCDTLIPVGAEAEYMEKLNDIREDMEELKEVPVEAVKKELRYQGRRIGKILLICAAVAAVIAVIFALNEKKHERDNTADYIWGHENFPKMNALYEEGKFEELEEFYFSALEEDRPVWNWEYYEAFSAILEDER